MKNFKVLIFVLAMMTAFLPEKVSAQGKYGKDSAECIKFLNFYRDSYRQGNLKEAFPLWKKAMTLCPPSASQNIFIHGQKIMKYRIANFNGDAAVKEKMIDSLLMLNDMRAQYYPNKAHMAHTNRLYDIIEYYGKDASKTKMIFEESMKVINEDKSDINTSLIVNAMIEAGQMYKNKQMTDEQVMNTYTSLNNIFESKLTANPDDETVVSDQKSLQDAFVTSGVATCDNLVKVFGPRFDSNKNDTLLIKQIASLLNSEECTDTDLFLRVVTQLYNLSPSAEAAGYLYALYTKKGDKEKANHYLREAANNSTGIKKATYMYDLATVYASEHSYGAAVSAARQAADANSSLAGKVYMLIGNIWASVSCGGNEISSRAKFWVATDYMIKAKQNDSSLAGEADKNISRYRQYFPKTEDAFMYDLTDGRSYSISCGGLSATTTVRTLK